MKAWPALLFTTLLLGAPALAGNVYRCEGSDGVTTYANKKVAGASCKLVGSYKAQRAPKPKAVAAPSRTSSRSSESPPLGGVPPATMAASQPARMSVPTAAEARVPAAPVVASSTPAAPRRVHGQVYSYIKDGVRTYSSARPRGMAVASVRTIKYSYMETCYACGTKPGVNFRTLRLNTTAYQAEIAAAAREHGVDESIVRAIIHAESAFNPNALSRVGAQGLMQLMPGTAREVGVSDAFDPVQNIGGGVRYLAMLLKRFNGNLTLAAAGYNAGPGAVAKYGGVPPYSETRRYVERVGLLADRYRGLANPVAAPAQGGLSAR
ncbi:lytic transglycosylase domain-containing protein [Thermomonas carbonis]|uniref:Lytic transglycosylase domain-containing protein n=1 Tax=Thermomonas carbonis TaxID=1463158 RepID=A0A7G9SQR9_9GAMM|nr:lytic transglycosylase domain-containing protein [Thermomonas carbonis]QNN70194.1 lytic transglycosylase domain-containing protein [Thermomonas carbonis]GHB98407.1 murein transglycosylase [Thermomonas carbonis]